MLKVHRWREVVTDECIVQATLVITQYESLIIMAKRLRHNVAVVVSH